MRLPARYVAGLLPLTLSGCFHFHHKTQQSQPVAPPITSSNNETAANIRTTLVELPPSATTIPARPVENIKEKPQSPRRPSRRKPASTQPQEVASNSSPAVSAIGQLSSGDAGSSRSRAEDSIASVEKGLNGIHRSLSDQERRTADHIHEFLKQARAALVAGDVDGAQTLASKAGVLLAELTK